MSDALAEAALPQAAKRKRQAGLTRARPGEGPNTEVLAASRLANLPLKDRARKLLENPQYLENLQQRLIDGEAGALEVWLYRYGYGDPKLDKAEEEEQKEEFERIRAEVRSIIAKGGQEGKVLDIAIQRSSRKLKRLPRPEDDDAKGR